MLRLPDLTSVRVEDPENLPANLRNVYLNKIELEQLKIENSRLKHANHVLSMQLGAYCRNDYATFPDEILLVIFRHALPPSWLLDERKPWASSPQDIPFVDLRTKLAILGVCKSWNRVGTGLLYERVTLRRITQLPVFVCTLEGREELRSLVKHVDINCFVPRGFLQLHEHETKRILELCSSLSHVGFSPTFYIPELPQCIPTINSGSITSLEYSYLIPYSDILPSLVHLSQNLKSLTFTMPAAYDEDHPVLTFPRLEDLCLGFTVESVVSPDKWRARPRRLWLENDYFHTCVPGVRQLLGAYGLTITYLRIYSLDQEMLERCPLLEHISVVCSVATLTHQRVRFIDTFTCEDLPFYTIESSNDDFPALLCWRDLGVTMKRFRYVPRSISPSSEGSPGGYGGADDSVTAFLEFTDPTFVDGAAFIRNDPDISDDYVLQDEDDDSGSSDYVSDSDASSSDAASCITVSEDGSHLQDEFYMQEDWEVGREEALEIFDRTRETW
ncbi:hypothetical protein C8R45DRAFT_135781 [Mycena sanguinolenta]|nr:hypothetical protein C8R45DRAFT_135781 [Mycena sanguinolenta]